MRVEHPSEEWIMELGGGGGIHNSQHVSVLDLCVHLFSHVPIFRS